MTTDIGTLLSKKPGVCGGRLCIAGTGVSVRRIAGWYKLGMTPEEIVENYGHISLAQVFAALTYYHANREQMDAEIAAEDAECDRLEQEHRRARSQRTGIRSQVEATSQESEDRGQESGGSQESGVVSDPS